MPILMASNQKLVRTCYSPGLFKLKLSPLQAKWPMEPALISGFCFVRLMRVFSSPQMGQFVSFASYLPPYYSHLPLPLNVSFQTNLKWDINPFQVSSQQTLVLIYLPRKDGKLRRKRRSHKYSNLGKASIKPGTLWLEGRDLTNCANHFRPGLFILGRRVKFYPGLNINYSSNFVSNVKLQFV